jgi:hypothetical protein
MSQTEFEGKWERRLYRREFKDCLSGIAGGRTAKYLLGSSTNRWKKRPRPQNALKLREQTRLEMTLDGFIPAPAPPSLDFINW